MLRERVKKFVNEFEMPITVFCRKVHISPASYYKWMQGVFDFSDETADRVLKYIEKYGF